MAAFLGTEAAGGAALLLAAVAALAWANSPWGDGYASLWTTRLRAGLGGVERSIDLRHLVNEGLMALFFLVVGLEVKRELVTGELRTWRAAALPVCGAAGGMIVPAALYLAVNPTGEAARGWGIPMATDIAFALAVLTLLGRRVPAALKVLVLALAVVDDLGAIVVLAVAYAGRPAVAPLLVAVAVGGALVGLRRAGVTWWPVHALLGLALWAAVYESGLHATIAGVVVGFLLPGRPAPGAGRREPVAERVERLLHPVTSFVVVPVFALANAGVVLDGAALGAPGAAGVAAGTALGLVAGKLVGVTAFSWLALRLGVGSLPAGVAMGHVVGAAAVAGVGFTVSLFVAGLAFDRPELEAAAKIGVMGGSLVAAAVGLVVLSLAGRPTD